MEFDNTDLDRALSAINKQIEKDRGNWEAWAAKADVLYAMGLYENAIMCCDRSLAINPDNPFTKATKANALDKQKKRGRDKANPPQSFPGSKEKTV